MAVATAIAAVTGDDAPVAGGGDLAWGLAAAGVLTAAALGGLAWAVVRGAGWAVTALLTWQALQAAVGASVIDGMPLLGWAAVGLGVLGAVACVPVIRAIRDREETSGRS